jgi:hypothetical protein
MPRSTSNKKYGSKSVGSKSSSRSKSVRSKSSSRSKTVKRRTGKTNKRRTVKRRTVKTQNNLPPATVVLELNDNKEVKNTLKHGGKNYKSIELHYKGKSVNCEICGTNNYYHRDSTLGRSKAANALYTVGFYNSLSVFALFCNECGLARILKKENIFDKNSMKYQIIPKNDKSLENLRGWPFRPLKA